MRGNGLALACAAGLALLILSARRGGGGGAFRPEGNSFTGASGARYSGTIDQLTPEQLADVKLGTKQKRRTF